MADESEATPTFPDCPRCGEPITMAVVAGPMTARVSPCGCRVVPESLE
ncbi:hypothetical protein [Natronorubrum texcoconense]|uniref:Small CPxCG-related zinc finger protein n=1 Tax=Natronorubrum texcoconense TaxID=1095776 RepID=A0A1G8TG66_9EURY|nr:hypothetical protein [Natronorubrum texcoconense]SDJ40508.1 hypothetical protein SAMN04515672_0457 [Natronorubrum texcoconense]